MVEHQLLETLGYLLPFGSSGGAPILAVGLEALVEDEDYRERGVPRARGRLGQRLQLVDVGAVVIARTLDELAHLVDDEQQAIELARSAQPVAQLYDRREGILDP